MRVCVGGAVPCACVRVFPRTVRWCPGVALRIVMFAVTPVILSF